MHSVRAAVQDDADVLEYGRNGLRTYLDRIEVGGLNVSELEYRGI